MSLAAAVAEAEAEARQIGLPCTPSSASAATAPTPATPRILTPRLSMLLAHQHHYARLAGSLSTLAPLLQTTIDNDNKAIIANASAIVAAAAAGSDAVPGALPRTASLGLTDAIREQQRRTAAATPASAAAAAACASASASASTRAASDVAAVFQLASDAAHAGPMVLLGGGGSVGVGCGSVGARDDAPKWSTMSINALRQLAPTAAAAATAAASANAASAAGALGSPTRAAAGVAAAQSVMVLSSPGKRKLLLMTSPERATPAQIVASAAAGAMGSPSKLGSPLKSPSTRPVGTPARMALAVGAGGSPVANPFSPAFASPGRLPQTPSHAPQTAGAPGASSPPMSGGHQRLLRPAASRATLISHADRAAPAAGSCFASPSASSVSTLPSAAEAAAAASRKNVARKLDLVGCAHASDNGEGEGDSCGSDDAGSGRAALRVDLDTSHVFSHAGPTTETAATGPHSTRSLGVPAENATSRHKRSTSSTDVALATFLHAAQAAAATPSFVCAGNVAAAAGAAAAASAGMVHVPLSSTRLPPPESTSSAGSDASSEGTGAGRRQNTVFTFGANATPAVAAATPRGMLSPPPPSAGGDMTNAHSFVASCVTPRGPRTPSAAANAAVTASGGARPSLFAAPAPPAAARVVGLPPKTPVGARSTLAGDSFDSVAPASCERPLRASRVSVADLLPGAFRDVFSAPAEPVPALPLPSLAAVAASVTPSRDRSSAVAHRASIILSSSRLSLAAGAGIGAGGFRRLSTVTGPGAARAQPRAARASVATSGGLFSPVSAQRTAGRASLVPSVTQTALPRVANMAAPAIAAVANKAKKIIVIAPKQTAPASGFAAAPNTVVSANVAAAVAAQHLSPIKTGVAADAGSTPGGTDSAAVPTLATAAGDSAPGSPLLVASRRVSLCASPGMQQHVRRLRGPSIGGSALGMGRPSLGGAAGARRRSLQVVRGEIRLMYEGDDLEADEGVEVQVIRRTADGSEYVMTDAAALAELVNGESFGEEVEIVEIHEYSPSEHEQARSQLQKQTSQQQQPQVLAMDVITEDWDDEDQVVEVINNDAGVPIATARRISISAVNVRAQPPQQASVATENGPLEEIGRAHV